MDVAKLHYYMTRIKKISGWFDSHAVWAMMIPINAAQIAAEVTGNWLEIGTYQGRSFIPMYLIRRPLEAAVAVDNFRAKEKRCCGKKPRPTRQLFWNNLKLHCGDLGHVRLIEKDSKQVTAAELMVTGPYRFIHIDGGHDAASLANDLGLAYQVAAPNAVILIDDYGHKAWPQVQAATQAWIRANDNDLRLIGVKFNKAIFVRETFKDRLRFLQF